MEERKTIKFVVFKAICGDQRDQLAHRVTKRRRLAVQSRKGDEERRETGEATREKSIASIQQRTDGGTSEPTDARS